MRKMEDGPCHSMSSESSGSDGAFELKYRQSSSCEVLLGLAVRSGHFFRSQGETHTLPTHMTQSLRLAGG